MQTGNEHDIDPLLTFCLSIPANFTCAPLLQKRAVWLLTTKDVVSPLFRCGERLTGKKKHTSSTCGDGGCKPSNRWKLKIEKLLKSITNEYVCGFCTFMFPAPQLCLQTVI